MNDTVNIQLLGDFRVLGGETTVELPKSKKTRALLAYLIVMDRPQRRERLCEIFWSTSEDPKATLRWSLSQLKKVAKQTGYDFLEIDRERVRVKSSLLRSDLEKLYIANDLRDLDLGTVTELALQANDTLLAGLDLPNLHDYSAWLAGERDKAVDLRVALILAYIHSPSFSAEDKIKYAKIWLELRPLNTDAATLLLALLKQGNRTNELNSWAKILTDRFQEAGIEFDANKEILAKTSDPFTEEQKLLSNQKINFCQTPDGHSLAYASTGHGPPLFKAANWLSHLELDWSAPIWSPIFKELSRDFQFIRYDERGNGLSDWNVDELSQAVFVQDLEAIIDQFDYATFPLLGISQGVAVCIDYAIAHPERVSKLVLFGGYPKGWRVDATPEVTALREAMMTLTRDGWGQENPAYRNVFSSTFMPTATPEQLEWFNDFQRHTTSPENAVRFLEAFADIDVRAKLSQIQVPTLVIHSRGDQRIDWTVGRDMAAEIPNAELVILESDNHLLLDGEPAADTFIEVVRRFLLG